MDGCSSAIVAATAEDLELPRCGSKETSPLHHCFEKPARYHFSCRLAQPEQLIAAIHKRNAEMSPTSIIPQSE
jgi:hypothetical protein